MVFEFGVGKGIIGGISRKVRKGIFGWIDSGLGKERFGGIGRGVGKGIIGWIGRGERSVEV